MENRYTAMPNLTIIKKVTFQRKNFYLFKFDADIYKREKYWDVIYGTIDTKYVSNGTFTRSFNMADLLIAEDPETALYAREKAVKIENWKKNHPNFTYEQLAKYVLRLYK